jgi:regulator of cell morphogenesis and NO signaling
MDRPAKPAEAALPEGEFPMASSPANTPPPASRRSGESSESEWEIRPLGELIRHIIERHHGWLRAELPEIGRSIRRAIEAGTGERSATLAEMEGLFRRFQREIEDHLKKEEAVLFPLIERLERASAAGLVMEQHSFGSIRNPIQFMTQDHELADHLLAKMKELAGQEAGSAGEAILERLRAVEADLATHVHLEDEVLFPRTIRLEEAGRPPAP